MKLKIRVHSHAGKPNAKRKFFLIFVVAQCEQQIGFPESPYEEDIVLSFAFAQCK